MKSFIEIAEEILAMWDWPVFPVNRETKIPCEKGGRNGATKERSIIERWGRDFPNANAGVPTGEASGVFVLDFDTAELADPN